MEYTKLTDEQKDAIKQGHIEQIESQHFSARVQLARARAGEPRPAEVQQLTGLLNQLEREHKVLTDDEVRAAEG